MFYYNIKFYYFILIFFSFFQHCVAPATVISNSLSQANVSVVGGFKAKSPTNFHGTSLHFNENRTLPFHKVNLKSDQKAAIKPVRSSNNDFSFSHGDLFNPNEYNDDDFSDQCDKFFKTREGIAELNLIDIENKNNYIEQQKRLYEETGGKEGFDIDKISNKLMEEKKRDSKLNKIFNNIKGFKENKNIREKIKEQLNKVMNFIKDKNHKEKEDFEEFFQYLALFAPKTFIETFLQIPSDGIQILLDIFEEILNDLKTNYTKDNVKHKVVDLKNYKNKINESNLTEDTKEKINNFFETVKDDFKKLPKYLTENFATLFKDIAEEGLPGLKEALIRYLDVWENATPEDQERMAKTFPQLAFFYNDPKSMMMNNWALHSAKGNFIYKLGLLVLLKIIFLKKPKFDVKLYNQLREKLEEDFKANEELINKIGNFFSRAKPIVGEPEGE